MKTTVIESRRPFSEDSELFRTLYLESVSEDEIWSEHFIVGIRNRRDQVYRVIGFRSRIFMIDALQKLHLIGYKEVVPTLDELRDGFCAVLYPPSNIKSHYPS